MNSDNNKTTESGKVDALALMQELAGVNFTNPDERITVATAHMMLQIAIKRQAALSSPTPIDQLDLEAMAEKEYPFKPYVKGYQSKERAAFIKGYTANTTAQTTMDIGKLEEENNKLKAILYKIKTDVIFNQNNQLLIQLIDEVR